MFAPRFYPPRYFAPRFFGSGGDGASAADGAYFAPRYFGATYFAPRYFPSDGDADPTPTPGEEIECVIHFPCALLCNVAAISTFAGASPAGIGVASNKAARSVASQHGVGLAGNKSGRSGRV